MKDYYKISEISRLYGIGTDSLRYYERLGILTPHRDTNGYRLYNLTDLYKLNIIRDLRQLDFSMAQIKEYLDDQSTDNTLALLRQEQELLHKHRMELKSREEIIQDRITSLESALTSPVGTVMIKTLPERLCIQLSEHITRDEEMDFMIKKLHQKHEDKIRNLGNQTIGAFLSMPDLKKGIANVYNSVFFVLEHENPDYDFVLPSGKYLSYFYRGDYMQNADRIRELMAYASEKELHILGNPFEIYAVDNRDTIRTEEFLTEIQCRVE